MGTIFALMKTRFIQTSMRAETCSGIRSGPFIYRLGLELFNHIKLSRQKNVATNINICIFKLKSICMYIIYKMASRPCYHKKTRLITIPIFRVANFEDHIGPTSNAKRQTLLNACLMSPTSF